MQLEPITWERMAEALARHLDGPARAAAAPGGWTRVAVDGAPAAGTGTLAAATADALRLRGRPVLVVATDGFLRPASLRFEFGREDAEGYPDGWYDVPALWREVFGPLEPGGSGRVLPDLWDPAVDRATRSPYVTLPTGGVLFVHGPMLLKHWFPFDFTVHIGLSAGALARRTDPGARWTLPAFARYEAETGPAAAVDVLVRADDPRHPAWSGLPTA
ncbi:uridine kinase [Streptomyces bambusae]|uniref:uridine kinase n=1 Tax=Streptomyces bambusae TaxID=1550616 RepID=UPI001CFD40B5|nr:uridine kinase [Streptomyces bambusae]MCB5166788.1 uridine kinase [Streptomyces bambusae]